MCTTSFLDGHVLELLPLSEPFGSLLMMTTQDWVNDLRMLLRIGARWEKGSSSVH
jgi:hypothetical protein